MKFIALIIVIMAVSLSYACKKVDKTPAEKIAGKWMVSSTEILGTVVPGDGSYLVFNDCSGQCSGADFRASDSSSGIFTYELNGDGSVLVINDTMQEGGNYNFSYDVLELSESNLRITAETVIFGNMLIKLTKN